MLGRKTRSVRGGLGSIQPPLPIPFDQAMDMILSAPPKKKHSKQRKKGRLKR